MILTMQQESALSQIQSWLKVKKSPVFVLSGYAGTGKTTLIQKIVEGLNDKTFFCAFTGKAALAMRDRGIPDAKTIHQTIYKQLSRKKLLEEFEEVNAEFKISEGEEKKRLQKRKDEINQLLSNPEFILNTSSEAYNAPLIVVDEFSMLTEKLVNDLTSFGKKILFIGDPGQLDPVDKENKEGKCPLKPDVFLTDVVRQALESPIIRAATSVREHGKLVDIPNCADFAALKRPASEEILKSADQVICGLNRTRSSINSQFAKKVEVGTKIVCLHNNHQEGIFNGQLATITGLDEDSDEDNHASFKADIESAGTEIVDLNIWKGTFEGKTPTYYDKKQYDIFDYGYAITCHKAQGSEFDKVVVIADWPGDQKKFLYTAITRAKKQCRVYF